MPVDSISIDLIRADSAIQPRTGLNEEAIEDYAEAIRKDVDSMPEIEAIFDGKLYWIYSGFHRFHAFCRLNRKEIPVLWEKGTKEEAAWKALAQNYRHGVRRSRADLRRTVTLALQHPGATKLSSRSIAAHCHVSHNLVEQIRKELEPSQSSPTSPVTRTATRKGKTYQITLPQKKEKQAAPTFFKDAANQILEEHQEPPPPDTLTLEKASQSFASAPPDDIGRLSSALIAALSSIVEHATLVERTWKNLLKAHASPRLQRTRAYSEISARMPSVRTLIEIAREEAPTHFCEECTGKVGECDACGGIGWLTRKG